MLLLHLLHIYVQFKQSKCFTVIFNLRKFIDDCLNIYILFSFYITELFAVNINGANTYSSSNVPGGLSEYSIDDDFMHMQPTCFQTDPAQPDLNGYHWLIIDFGIHLHHIKEIRLAPNPFHKYFGKLNHHYFQKNN